MNEKHVPAGRNTRYVPTGGNTLFPLWFYQVRSGSKMVIKSRRQLEVQLIARALRDVTFREALLTIPKATTEIFLGFALPPELEYTVVEETDEVAYLVVPCNPYRNIADDELKTVSGFGYREVANWMFEEQSYPLLEQSQMIDVWVRAWRDPLFLQELVTNPANLLAREFGIYFDQIRTLRAVHESPVSLVLVVPNLRESSTTIEAFSLIDDELMVNILATPCFETHADPCGPGPTVILG